MATARSPTQTWVGRNGILYLAAPASGVTFGASTSLSGSFTSVGYSVTAAVKSLTITPPETAWEKQDLMGKLSGASFQNQLLDEKPVGNATLTGTLVLGEDETVENIISGTWASSPSGYTRYQYGSDETSRGTVAACVTLISPVLTEEVSFAFDNARFTKLGDTRISGPDSHWEQDFTVTCLAKDFYYEFKD